MSFRFALRHTFVALAVLISSVIATSSAMADILYNETWAGGYTADTSAINFGWGSFTTNAAVNAAANTVGINTVNASFPRSDPQPQNVNSPYPANPTGTLTTPTLAQLSQGYLAMPNSTAANLQWTNEYLTYGNALGIDPTAGPVTFGFSIANAGTGKNARLAIELSNGSWVATNATYTSGAFPVANLGTTPQPVVPTFSVDFSKTGSVWRDLSFDGSMTINAADGRGTAVAGTVLSLASTARTSDLPAANIIAWGVYWEPDGGAGGNRRADSFSVSQDAPALPPTRFLTWNNVPGGGNGNTWDIGTSANWNSTALLNPNVYQENDAVTFNDTNNGNYTVNLNTAVKPGGITVNTTGTYTIQGTGSIGGGHGLAVTAGTLVLAANATYSGGTSISNGATLRVGNGGTAGGLGTKDVTNNGSLIINRSDAVSFTNLITGTGSVSQNGAGTTTLAGNSSFSGGLTVNAGAVRLGGSGAGTGSIIANAGSTVVYGSTIANPITLSGASLGAVGASLYNGDITFGLGNSTIYLADPQFLPTVPATDVFDVVFTKALNGSGNVTILSNGQDNSPDGGNGFRLRSATAGSFSGRLTLGNNVKAELQTTVAAPAVFSPLGAGTVVMTGGDAQLAANVLTNTTTGGYSELILRNNTAATETVRDAVFGTNVEITGTGLAVLNPLSDTSAPVGAKVTLGNLKIGTGQEVSVFGAGGPGYAVEFSSVTLNGNATFSPRKAGYGDGALLGGDLILNNVGQSTPGSGITVAGTRTVFMGGTSTYTGPTNIESGTLSVTGSLLATGTVNVNGSLAPAILAGTGSVGNLTSGFGGTVSPGTTAAPIGTLTAQSIQPSTGSFLMQISGATADRINVTGAASLAGSTLTIALPTPATPGTYTLFSAGSVSGLPTLSKPNVGRTNFALNQVGGNVNVTVSGGAASIRWDNTGSAGDGTTWDTQQSQNWKNGAVSDQFYEADNVLFNDTNNGKYSVNVSGPVLPASITINNSAGDYVFNGGDISGATSLVKNGTRALTLNNLSSFSGGVVLNQGTLNLGGAGSVGSSPLGTGPLTINGGTIDNTSFNLLNLTTTTNNAQIWNGNFTYAGSESLNIGTAAVILTTSPVVTVNQNPSLLTASTLTVGGAINGGTNSLTKAGDGTLTLTGAGNYSGGLNVNGGFVRLQNATAAGTGTITVNAGGTLVAGLTTATTPAVATWANDIVLNGGTLGSAGVGTANGTRTNTGNVTVQADSTIKTGDPQGVGATGSEIEFGNTGTGTPTALKGSGNLNVIADQAGADGGAGFRIQGTGNSTYTGTITVNNHVKFELQTAVPASTGTFSPMGTGKIVMVAGTYDASLLGNYSEFQVRNVVANGGNVTVGNNIEVTGTGLADLNFPAAVTNNVVSMGSLKIGNQTLGVNKNSGTYAFSSVTISGTPTFSPNTPNFGASGAADLRLGPISESVPGSGIKIDSGTTGSVTNFVRLDGVNTYTGPTQISRGALRLGASNRLPDNAAMILGDVNVGAPATFQTDGFSETLGTLSLQTAGTIDLGAAASTVHFAASDINTLWNFNTLSISNWSPGADHIFFGNSASGLGATTFPTFQIAFAGHGSSARILSTGEVLPALSVLHGDFDQDGAVTPADVRALLAALADVNGYKNGYALSQADFETIVDFDGDHLLTNRDIQPFLNSPGVGSGSLTSVPEPGTLSLLAIGAIFLYRARRRSR
jgi:fibronectin-binding autotransporter adhesin